MKKRRREEKGEKEMEEEEEREGEGRGGKGGRSSIMLFTASLTQLIHGLKIKLSTNQLVKGLIN